MGSELLSQFPQTLKTAIVKPLLKKSTLDPQILNNYRPISNLPFLGKILEKVVYKQLYDHLNLNSIFERLQSGFRPHHSTETALLKVVNDIRLSLDNNLPSILVLLDLSAAFDTVDHAMLLSRLQHHVGLSGPVLNWFRTYLSGRDYFVSLSGHSSASTPITCGVPQGSILGPVLFSLYMLPLGNIIRRHGIDFHSYADDTQLYISVSPNDTSPIASLIQCIEQMNTWMSNNFLQLNKDKTEVLVIGPKTQRELICNNLNTLAQNT